jgi:hypothetical protein
MKAGVFSANVVKHIPDNFLVAASPVAQARNTASISREILPFNLSSSSLASSGSDAV